MKKLLAILVALLAPALAHAQGGGMYEQVLLGPGGVPVVNAQITVCSGIYAGLPTALCTTTLSAATVYSDPGLSVPLAQPFTTGPNGNIKFFAATATYSYSVAYSYAPTVSVLTDIIAVGSGAGSAGIPALECYGAGLAINWDVTLGTVCSVVGRQISVVENPSIVNGPNLITPGDLSTTGITFQPINGQTQPMLLGLSFSGSTIWYIDPAGNAAFNTVTALNANPVSSWKYSSAPSGDAVAGSVRTYVDSSLKRWCTNDDAGVDFCPANDTTTGTFANKTFGTSTNTLNIGSQGITSVSGNTGEVATVSGSKPNGDYVKFDSNGNVVDGGGGATANNAIFQYYSVGLVASSLTNGYLVPASGSASSASSGGEDFVIPYSCTFKNLYGNALSGGVNSSSGVVTVFIAGSASVVTFTFGTGTTGSDTTHNAAITAGQAYSIRISTQASETLSNPRVTVQCQ
jgi:hypothetical protein